MRPMFATPGPLPLGPRWRYEVRWSGLRVLADVTGGTLRLTTDRDRDVTEHFPEFAGLAGRLRDGLLDGEIVILDDGVPSRAATGRRLAGRPTGPAALVLFDVLRLYGVSLLHRPLDERRATLERLRLDRMRGVSLSPVYDDGPALLDATRRHRLSGVVAKHADSRYRPGLVTGSWCAGTSFRATADQLGQVVQQR